MTTEQRIVRPFHNLADVQHWLNGVGVEIGGHRAQANRSLSVAVESFVAERASLSLAVDDGHWRTRQNQLSDLVAGLPIDMTALDLVAVTTAPRLHVCEVAFTGSLANIIAGQRSVALVSDRRPTALSAPFGGCIIDIAIVLNRDLRPKGLLPYRRGTWLAKVTCRITTDLGQIGFTPIPLTDDIRREHALPERTLRLITTERVTDPEIDADTALTVYVDQELLAQLTAEPRSRGSRTLQMQLFLDAMTAVVHAASREIAAGEGSTTFSEAQESLLGTLIRQMAARDNEIDIDAAERLWATVRHIPDRAVALIEGWLPEFKNVLVNSISENNG